MEREPDITLTIRMCPTCWQGSIEERTVRGRPTEVIRPCLSCELRRRRERRAWAEKAYTAIALCGQDRAAALALLEELAP